KETEVALATLFRKNHLSGWRRHLPLIGRPDFCFARERVVVFVDGCFWHCCPACGNIPKNNREFWQRKLSGNQARDRLVTRELRKRGWRVIRVWEHDLRQPKRILRRIEAALSRYR